MTVEPGVYIPEWGIGCLEVDIVITSDGCAILFDMIPREAAEIEAWIADARQSGNSVS